MTNLHKCPDCLNTFHQPFRCTTCGAQRLYDETVRTQAKTIAALRKDRADLWRALHRLHGTITDAIAYDEDSELGQDIFSAAAVLDRAPPARSDASAPDDDLAALTSLASMLDTIKSQDWAECWSEHDQGLRDWLTQKLRAAYAARGTPVCNGLSGATGP